VAYEVAMAARTDADAAAGPFADLAGKVAGLLQRVRTQAAAKKRQGDELLRGGRFAEAADAYGESAAMCRRAAETLARLRELAGKCEDNVAIDLGNGIKIEFVLVQPGTFEMGSADGESDEVPVHEVAVTRPFFLGKYEVTQQQWRQVMDENPSLFKGDRMPVESVSWYDCQKFLERLNELAPGRDFRLPTEAEREYACRAGTKTTYSFGDADMPLDPYAWVDTTSENEPHPVGLKLPNPWGLYDMHGNVWEWCSDWHSHDYYAESPVDDPQGPPAGDKKVLRGGSWSNPGPYSRSANRGYYDPNARHNNYGLRVAWTERSPENR